MRTGWVASRSFFFRAARLRQGYGALAPVFAFALRSKRRLERATGIEPAWPAWKAGTLPLSYARADSASPARTKLSRVGATAKRFFRARAGFAISGAEV